MGAGGSCCQGAGDDERMVTKIDLSHCGCTEVPPIVFQAERYVETLNLAHNRILSLPPQLFHCQELKHLNLVDNGLDSLPPAIGSLLHLVSLKLDKNCIKDLPDNIKMCRKLKRLSINNNQLQQLPGIVTQLISLEELYMNDCDLSFLPASVGRLTKLRILELRNNRLCNLPLSMSRMTSLSRLDLGDNSFETLPECSSSLCSLHELFLDNNDLETMSGAGLKKLEHLDVSYNNLRTIAKDIGQCTALTFLNLGWNYIETLPDSISNLTQLEFLIMEMNELSTLPRSLGKVTRLEEINVSNNRLCDLPPTLGLLRHLTFLNISRNYVQELPCEIGSCTRLSIMNASYNRLQSLPAEIGYLNNLKVMDVVGNFLMYLPISMSNLTGVRAIWLSANQNVPLIPFTEDVSMASGERFLTNIALPQLGETAQPPVETTEPIEKPTRRRKIRFEEDGDLLPGRLDRTPTPFPKELRCPARKASRPEDNYVNVVDGRVPVFQPAQSPPSGVAYHDSNVTIIREANIRKNNNDKNDVANIVYDNESNTGMEPVYETRRYDTRVEQYEIEPLRKADENEKINFPEEINNSEDIQNMEMLPEQVYGDIQGHLSNGVAEPTYVNRTDRLDNGRMSPITEEPQKGLDEVTETPEKTEQEKNDENLDSTSLLGKNESRKLESSDSIDAVSIDSFESERRRSLIDSVDNRPRPMELNQNHVIYSNLRNGNPYQFDARSYQNPGYFNPPRPPFNSTEGSEPNVPYRSMTGYVDAAPRFPPDDPTQRRNYTPNGIGPDLIARQSPYGTVRQSPHMTDTPNGMMRQSPYQHSYGVIRQSPHHFENGNHVLEMERPPSKQEMLSIAERNRSQNISPPCYEIAKMYSTKAALFEHCHRQGQT